jgi:hypothetical protein
MPHLLAFGWRSVGIGGGTSTSRTIAFGRFKISVPGEPPARFYGISGGGCPTPAAKVHQPPPSGAGYEVPLAKIASLIGGLASQLLEHTVTGHGPVVIVGIARRFTRGRSFVVVMAVRISATPAFLAMAIVLSRPGDAREGRNGQHRRDAEQQSPAIPVDHQNSPLLCRLCRLPHPSTKAEFS